MPLQTTRRPAACAAQSSYLLLVLLAFIWSVSHRYTGLDRDGELYAMQALSRLQPSLRTDLYLGNNSQDKYTLFSPLYAFFIQYLGLWNAGVTLFVASRVLFYAAAWGLIRRLAQTTQAWISLVLLIAATGEYGGYGIFSFAESYLSARSVAEALVALALVLTYARRPIAAWSVIVASFAIHPLMTLPGALMMACLALGARWAVVFSIAGLSLATITALLLSKLHLGGMLEVVDGQWLYVIRQRSQFLFLNEWRQHDWIMHGRPFVSLALTYAALPDPRIRRLCLAGILVGLTGLVLAWIAGSIGPIAILLQSQTWRWFWLTSFISIVLLGPLVITLWKRGGVERMCATLVVISWIFPLIDGLLMQSASLVLWLVRSHVRAQTQRFVQWTAYLCILAILIWTCANAWTSIVSPLATNTDQSALVGHLRAIFQLPAVPVVLVLLALWWLASSAKRYIVAGATIFFAGVTLVGLPGTFLQHTGYGSDAQIRAFDDWRQAVPEGASVLAVPEPVGAMFIWFTLGRASYLTLDQSSGVVFSRATAQEIARRSEVLRPIEAPDWEIKRRIDAGVKRDDERYPLTDESLRQICEDAALGFVIADEDLPEPSLTHSVRGPYNGSRLYDCRQIRELRPH